MVYQFLHKTRTGKMYTRQTTTTSLPIYVQISELLIREIAAGRLPNGSRLPPERDLAKTYGISVRTLRKALVILEEKNVLERIQGSGNYVRAHTSINSVYSMFRLELLNGGGLPTARVLEVETLDKPDDLPAFGKSDRAARIRRLRFLNQTPIAVEEIWIDASAGRVDPNKLLDSLYEFYKKELGLWISRAEDYVSIGPTPDWAPAEFHPKAGAPVGYITRFGHSDQKGSIEFSRTWFDPERAHYVQRLT